MRLMAFGLSRAHIDEGKIDIKQKIDEAGSDRLVDAVPLICEPGDVAITSRQAIHGFLR